MTGCGDPHADPGRARADGSAVRTRTAAPARADDSPLPDRLTRLARVTSELTRADTVDAVAKTVVTHGADAVGAMSGAMSLLSDDGRTVRLVALNGTVPGTEEIWRTFPVSEDTPSAEVIRTGVRLVLTGEHAVAGRFPHVLAAAPGTQAVVTLPLSMAPRTLGAISLLFDEPRDLAPAELEFLDILADACAQGLDRIAAQRAAETQTEKLTFLAEAATELASSLDYEVTLAHVARMAVPTFADWCAIDLVDDGRLRRLAVAHVDPAKVQIAHELAERYPDDPDSEHGAWQVMRTGRSQLIAEITDEILVEGATDEEHLAILRTLHLRSAVTVPLVARGRVLGVITWVAAESERRYTADDLSLAEELAKRAAVSIDNAELHSQTLAAAVQLQHAVLPQTLPAPPGWEIARYYRPSGRTEVGGDFYDVLEIDEHRLVLFVGDVMGRGVGAAAAMAQMRAAVRAYAALDPTPELVLSRLDQMYARLQAEQLVTLVYLLVDPVRDSLVVGNAGHPPPIVLHADGTVTKLPFADGPPLGVASHRPRREAEAELRRGDTVVAFTDGLIERRGEDITVGQERNVHAVRRLAGEDLSEALIHLAEEVSDPSRDDDVAVIAARRRD